MKKTRYPIPFVIFSKIFMSNSLRMELLRFQNNFDDMNSD